MKVHIDKVKLRFFHMLIDCSFVSHMILLKLIIIHLCTAVFAQNKQKRRRGVVNVRDINQGMYYLLYKLD